MNIASLRCVSQVALLGQVTPNLRAVTTAFDSECIRLCFYYDQEPSEQERELAEEVASEIISDFTEYMIETEKIILAYPHKIPNKKDIIFIYHRHEPLP